MAEYEYDLVTIGAGSGGVAGSRRAAEYGARVALVESGRVGGTCVLRGCVPKKLLVYGSAFAEEFADARHYGWNVPEPSFDWPTLIAAKDRELERLEGIYEGMLERAKVELVRGHGFLVDAHTVRVGDRTLTAANVMIAVGGRPVKPATPWAEYAIDSDDALALKTLPRRVLVIGGGYIAVEFAGIFRGFGSEVTVALRREHLLAGFDHDIASAVQAGMELRGIDVRTTTQIREVTRLEDGCLDVTFDDGSALIVDAIMAATGRRPNIGGIGLEGAGVAVENGAIVVDEWSRTSVPSVYAVGDVTNRINLTPVAIAEGRGLAETLFNDNPMPTDHENVPSAVFSQPEAASVGLSEADACADGTAIRVYRARFRPMRETLTGGAGKIMMKLVVDDASDRVLGCHMVGPHAAETIQGLAVAVKAGATKAVFDATVGIHPSAAEEFVTMRFPVDE